MPSVEQHKVVAHGTVALQVSPIPDSKTTGEGDVCPMKYEVRTSVAVVVGAAGSGDGESCGALTSSLDGVSGRTGTMTRTGGGRLENVDVLAVPESNCFSPRTLQTLQKQIQTKRQFLRIPMEQETVG